MIVCALLLEETVPSLHTEYNSNFRVGDAGHSKISATPCRWRFKTPAPNIIICFDRIHNVHSKIKDSQFSLLDRKHLKQFCGGHQKQPRRQIARHTKLPSINFRYKLLRRAISKRSQTFLPSFPSKASSPRHARKCRADQSRALHLSTPPT